MCSDFMLTNFVFYFCIYCIESPLNTQMLRDERRALGMNYHNGAKYFLKSHLNSCMLKSQLILNFFSLTRVVQKLGQFKPKKYGLILIDLSKHYFISMI